MNDLKNEDGIICVRIAVFPEDGGAWAMAVSWKKYVDGMPNARDWERAIDAAIAECERGRATSINSRVITASEGVPESLATARAALHRDSLVARGFTRGEDRVEYYMDLTDALGALEAREIKSELEWRCVDAEDETELAGAADVLRQAAESDPTSHPDDDALGFLKVLLEDEDATQAPERIQIGMRGGDPAAILTLVAYPSDGWSSIHYLGVLPAFRRRGLGAEAMLQGLRSLKAMGGTIYHDGTGASNAAARALFAQLRQSPFRVMEQWRREGHARPDR